MDAPPTVGGIDWLIATGVQHYQIGQFERALAFWREALIRDPGAQVARDYFEYVTQHLDALQSEFAAQGADESGDQTADEIGNSTGEETGEPTDIDLRSLRERHPPPELPPAPTSDVNALHGQTLTPATGVSPLLLAATCDPELLSLEESPGSSAPRSSPRAEDLFGSGRATPAHLSLADDTKSPLSPSLLPDISAWVEPPGLREPARGEPLRAALPPKKVSPRCVVRVRVPVASLTQYKLNVQEAFIISQLDGQMNTEDVADISGLDHDDILVLLGRLLDLGVVAVD